LLGDFGELHSGSVINHDALVDLASEVPLQAADDVLLGESFLSSSVHVGNRWLVILHPHDDGSIERGVGLAVTTPIEPVFVGESRRGGDGTDAAELRKRRLGVDALGVVAKDDEHFGGRIRTNGEPLTKRGCGVLGESVEQSVVFGDLLVENYPAPGQRTQRVLGLTVDRVNIAGPVVRTAQNERGVGEARE